MSRSLLDSTEIVYNYTDKPIPFHEFIEQKKAQKEQELPTLSILEFFLGSLELLSKVKKGDIFKVEKGDRERLNELILVYGVGLSATALATFLFEPFVGSRYSDLIHFFTFGSLIAYRAVTDSSLTDRITYPFIAAYRYFKPADYSSLKNGRTLNLGDALQNGALQVPEQEEVVTVARQVTNAEDEQVFGPQIESSFT